VVEGYGHLAGPDIALPLQPGATFFIPAASRHEVYQAAPASRLTLVKCFPPDL
jgi:quercetin dioxygenase-like cupin family protein